MHNPPFNLSEFKAGRPALDCHGRLARFVYHCPTARYEDRLGYILDGGDRVLTCSDTGLIHNPGCPEGLSVQLQFMAPATKDLWVAISKTTHGDWYLTTRAYSSEKDAQESVVRLANSGFGEFEVARVTIHV